MPELPEVENLARGLTPRILGAAIRDVRCHFSGAVGPDPECFANAVVGRRFQGLVRRGKYLFLRLEGSTALVLHLRMTGQLLLVPADHAADKHTHLEMLLDRGDRKLIFRDVRKFGSLRLLEASIEGYIAEKKLGPDALDISPLSLHRSFQATRRTIKAALLDQRFIAGLGNIYTDEVLFRAGISPLRPAACLSPSQVESLCRTITEVLRSAIRSKGTTISDYLDAQGRSGRFQNSLMVYSRAGEPCRVCGAIIEKSRVAGRGTYTCPVCQSG